MRGLFKRFFEDLENYSIPIEDFKLQYPTVKDEYLFNFPAECIKISEEDF